MRLQKRVSFAISEDSEVRKVLGGTVEACRYGGVATASKLPFQKCGVDEGMRRASMTFVCPQQCAALPDVRPTRLHTFACTLLLQCTGGQSERRQPLIKPLGQGVPALQATQPLRLYPLACVPVHELHRRAT